MSLSSLQVLAQHRDALLLAEVAAWLHDMGKCADEHIINQASDKPQGYSYKYKTAQTHRLPTSLNNVSLLGENVSVKDLIEQGMPRVISDTSQPWLLRVLGKCHAVAHVEKELDEKDKTTKQPKGDTRLSTAYGFEGQPVTGLTALLDNLPWNALTNRSAFVPKTESAFDQALGDTRRPVNEVTLADWSDAVAGLYKSALAGALLGIQPDPDNLHWRLLRVNFDVLGLYAKAVRIADLLGYQRAVSEAFEAVKKLVEEEYPLGNEVYCDTTGIYFTFPDLDLPADLAQEIRRRVEEVEPELAPRIAVTVGHRATSTEQLKGILAKARGAAVRSLAQPFDSQNLSTYWQQQWETVGEGKWELCPVCRLRPMQEGREACEHCLERRTSRIAEWQANPQRTIWIDELADANGRVALLVGKFGLDNWLSGDLVQTMLVKADPATNTFMPKNPSPARLRRVWETCRRFWTETVEQTVLAQHDYSRGDSLRCVRYLVIPDQKTGWKENVPYDGTIDGKAISLLWQGQGQRFVTISNLQWTEGINNGQKITVADPDDPKRSITFTVQGTMRASGNLGQYRPYLPLLASPDQLLALVPAADALEIAARIREEYIWQFGKVQNRLPLFLGIVFFPRKMPLLAVMDAARRMLDAPLDTEQWTVECCRPEEQGQKQYVRLSQGEKRLSLKVPIKMGDGQTDDIWYPYVFVERFADSTPDSRTYCFQHNSRWLVHVKDLKEDDIVTVIPSRFAYLWLEHTARRFAFDPAQDMLLLEELPPLIQMWGALKTSGITDTGLRNVQALLEAKASAWDAQGDEFKHLVETTLKEAGICGVITPDDVASGRFASGRFARCLELYMHILKQKIKIKED